MNLNLNAVRKPRPTLTVTNFRKNIMGPPRRPPVRKKTTSTSTSSLHWGATQPSVAHHSRTLNTSSSSAGDRESRSIAAVSEGRGEARCEIGIGFINTLHPTLVLCQISDSQAYNNTLTKINIFNPDEIIVPATFLGDTNNRLVEKIKQQFPNIKIIGQPRKLFNKAQGMEIISKLCLPAINSICVSLQHKYYALASASALINHVQDSYAICYVSESINIKYEESEGFAIIDVSTADRLELVSSMKPEISSRYSSLFDVLNHCVTKIGARHLRSTILQPPYSVEEIERHLLCVQELVTKPRVLTSIQIFLQKIVNVNQLLAITTLRSGGLQNISPRQLNYLLIVNGLLEMIEPFKSVLEPLEQDFFKNFIENLSGENFTKIRNLLRNTINPSAHFIRGEGGDTQRCFAIKPGLNGVLDLVRKTYTERMDDMKRYVRDLATRHNLGLTLGNTNKKGYHIVLKLSKQQKWTLKESELPKCFVQVCRTSTALTMKSHELMNFSARLDDIRAEILRISNIIIDNTVGELKPYIGFFFKLCEDIAHLDFLQSLAETSRSNNYVRPKFNIFTEIINAKHPVLDHLLPDIVPNSISISPEYNIHLITGPNGSGKSIYIRQAMLIQVMAQIGCYVPAASAILRPMQQIVARVYLEDNMEFGASAFILEMKEMKHIMTLTSPNSLFIIDELCRSTSADEGAALAMALTEKLVKSKSFVSMTTHYVSLAELQEIYLNVKTWHMETVSEGDGPRDLFLDFQFRLVPGVTALKHYGAFLVKKLWPNELVDNVYETLLQLGRVTRKEKKITSIHPGIRLKYKLESDLVKLKLVGNLTRAEINKHLNGYQNELNKIGYFDDLDVHFRDRIANSVNNIMHSFQFEKPQSTVKMECDEFPQDESCATMGSSTGHHNLTDFPDESQNNIHLLEPEVNISSFDKREMNFRFRQSQSREFTVTQNDNNRIAETTASPTCWIAREENATSESTNGNESDESNKTIERSTTSSSNIRIGKNADEIDDYSSSFEDELMSVVDEVESQYLASQSQTCHENNTTDPLNDHIPNANNKPLSPIIQHGTPLSLVPAPIRTSPLCPAVEIMEHDDQICSRINVPVTKRDRYVEQNVEEVRPSSLYPEVIVLERSIEPSPPSLLQDFRETESISYSPLLSPEVEETTKSNTNFGTSTSGSVKVVSEIKNLVDSTTSSSATRPYIRRKNKRFVPPKRLTKKEIQEEFARQDKELYEASMASKDYSAYLHKVLHRPSVNQVHKMKHLVSARWTEEGVEVIPAKPTRPRKSKFKRQLTEDSSVVNVTNIFSDRNAETFESFVNSDEKDIKKFNFLAYPPQAEPGASFNFDCSNTNHRFSFYPRNMISEKTVSLDRSNNLLNVSHDSIDNIADKYNCGENRQGSIFEDDTFDDHFEI